MENQNTSPWDTENNSANSPETTSIEAELNEPDSSDSSIINAGRYATLTGFNQQTNHSERGNTEDTESTSPEEEDYYSSNPYQERTLHSFSSHPIPKIILVFGGVLIAVLLAGTILNSHSFTPTSREENQEPVPTATSNNSDESDAPELEKGELLTEIAIAEQKKQLQALDAQQNTSKSTPSPSSYQPNSQSLPTVPSTPPPQVIYRTVPVSAPAPVPRWTDTPLTETKPIDPQQAWIAATQIGNYGTVTSISIQAQANPQNNLASSNHIPLINSDKTHLSQNTNSSAEQILIGSKVKAILTNPIVWDNRNTSSSQKPLFFRLEEPLSNGARSVVIPQGAQIIATIDSVSNSGIVDIKANSVLLEKRGNWQEIPLPPDTLYIQGKKGKPLAAKSLSENNSPDWRGLAAEAIGTAASEVDLPGRSNIPRVIERLTPSRSRYSTTRSFQWLLKGDTKVEIWVGRSFSLPSETSHGKEEQNE